MPPPDDRTNETQSGISRRGLLRGVAWAAPVIVVATAAPGASASGGDIVIVFDNFYVGKVWGSWPNDWGGVLGNLQIDRTGVGPNLTQLTVTLTFETRLGLTGVSGSVDLTGSNPGWSVQSVSVGATYTVYTFAWNGTMVPFGNTGILDFDIPTTIVAPMASIGSFPVAGFANSPQVTVGIASNIVVA
ncbi:MAG: hypothetical protein IT190_02740 [Microbacteriaceae bacterium]|nr:hypothetical protein [Microbacteriaceae bacterium]